VRTFYASANECYCGKRVEETGLPSLVAVYCEGVNQACHLNFLHFFALFFPLFFDFVAVVVVIVIHLDCKKERFFHLGTRETDIEAYATSNESVNKCSYGCGAFRRCREELVAVSN
jgi:hypothetical protein